MITETNCTPTLECPALPRVTLDQAVIDLLERALRCRNLPSAISSARRARR